MKRLLLIALLPAFTLGCGQTEADKERAETSAAFEAVAQDLERAVSGTVEGSKDKPYTETQEVYRREKLASATEKLRQLANRGEPLQQVSVHALLAEAEKSTALATIHEATLAWSRKSPEMMALIGHASQIRLANARGAAHSAVDVTQQLADARAAEAAVQTEREQLTKESDTLKGEAADLEAKIAELDTKRNDRTQKADALSRRAFATKGQESYDLYVQAADLTTQADDLTAEREWLDAQLDNKKSELAIINAKLGQINAEDGRLASIRKAIQELEDRAAKHKQLAVEAKALAEQSMAEFDTQFESFTAHQAEQVDAKFDAAIAGLEKAIQDAQTALSSSTSTTRTSAQLELASRKLMLGLARYERAQLTEAYSATLGGIVTAIEPVDATKAGTIAEAAEAATARADETTQAAITTINEAVTELQKVADDAKGAKAVETEISALRLQIAGLRAVAAATGDEAQAARVPELLTRIAELQQQP